MNSVLRVNMPEPMASTTKERRLQRFVLLSEWPLAILALSIIPSLLLDDHTPDTGFHTLSETLNWIVWLAFWTSSVGRYASMVMS